MDSDRFILATARIDEANARDPRRIPVGADQVPHELLYARRMSAWLGRLAPDASEALRIAVRAQHLRRWEIPRDTFPMTRQGYHAWREHLARFHADGVAEILRDVGYDDATIARVRSLVLKERLKADAEAQTLEDVACLVFLESELPDFAGRHEEEKVLNILRRTWKKMSPRGRDAAMTIDFPEPSRRMIEKALVP